MSAKLASLLKHSTSQNGSSETPASAAAKHDAAPVIPAPIKVIQTTAQSTIEEIPNIKPSGNYSTPVSTQKPVASLSASSSTKCSLCTKTVYKVEELKAIGQLWHKTCFKCGGTAGDGCGRTLTLDKYLDHDNNPYCNACYGKLYRPKGFGLGNTLNTDYGKTGVEEVQAAQQAIKVDVTANDKKKSAEQPAPSTPASVFANNIESTPNIKPSGNYSTPSEAPAPAVSTSSAKKFEASGKVAAVSSFTSATPKCTSCAKTVYKVEELKAVSRLWHKTCFKCGGTAGDGCGRTLTLDKYLDHDNNPYCNACCGKLYRPKGFGFGNTLNTDYGKTGVEEVQAAAAVLSVSKVSLVDEKSNLATEPSSSASKAVVPPPPPPSKAVVPPSPPRQPVAVAAQGSAKAVAIGSKTGNNLHKEATYIGKGDEVDESEW